MDFSELIQRRKSVRRFSKRPVSERDLKKILSAVQLAPSAGNLQAFYIAVVRERELIEMLAEAALGQEAVREAPAVLCFFADPERSSIRYGTRGRKLYSLQDATIACCYAQLQATNLGLASVWIGAFRDRAVQQIAGIPSHLIPVALLPVGYPAEEPSRPPRRPLSKLVKWL